MDEENPRPESTEPNRNIEYSYSYSNGSVNQQQLQGMTHIVKRKRDAFTVIREQQYLERKIAYLKLRGELQDGKQRRESWYQDYLTKQQRKIRYEKQQYARRMTESKTYQNQLRSERANYIKDSATDGRSKRMQQIERDRANKALLLKRQNQHAEKERRKEEQERLEYLRKLNEANRTVGKAQTERRHRYEIEKLSKIRYANEEEVIFYEKKSQEAAKYIDELRRQYKQIDKSRTIKSDETRPRSAEHLKASETSDCHEELPVENSDHQEYSVIAEAVKDDVSNAISPDSQPQSINIRDEIGVDLGVGY